MFEKNNVHVIVRALKQHLALQGKPNASAARIGEGGTESGERGGVRTCERRTRERASERPIRRGAYSARRCACSRAHLEVDDFEPLGGAQSAVQGLEVVSDVVVVEEHPELDRGDTIGALGGRNAKAHDLLGEVEDLSLRARAQA